MTASEEVLSGVIAEAASLVPEGRITHVVNCAGYILEGAVEETTQEEVRKVFETNVLGSVNIARAVVGKLRETGGVLVQMGSLGSWMGGGGFALCEFFTVDMRERGKGLMIYRLQH